MKVKFITAVLIISLFSCCALAVSMQSPDKHVEASITLTAKGELQYSVSFKGEAVIESSGLGITVGGVDLGTGVELGRAEDSQVDYEYQTRGNHTQARNHFNLFRFPVKHKTSKRSLTLEFRLYNDGAAYRYIVPGSGVQHVDCESSSWKIMPGATVWYFERLTPGWKLKSYAGEWISTSVENLHKATPARVGPVQGTPLVLDLPKDLGYAAITKAACYDYSGMRLKAIGNRTVVADFTEGKKGFDVKGDVVTPWRAVLLVDDLNELVNSDFINNLNPAPDPKLFADMSYIRPGRSVWSWETIGLGTPDDQRRFIDMAADLDFEYSIVDDGWKDWTDPFGTVKNLCDFAKKKDVGVFVWVHSKDIRAPADDYRQMRDYFDKVRAAGACGLKIDFMNGESKDLIDFEIKVLQEAAKRKLLINFHGCHASTGEERTYPNEVTREGIRGIEVNKMKEGPLPASHNAALPFTRFVVGHGDYTPVLYTNPGATTWAHQLATTVLYNSPLQVYSESPELMMTHPVLKPALSVMKAIPTVWDETIVLSGSSIGDMAVFARRSGEGWFVGILNGGKARDYDLDLGFLGKGDFKAVMVIDDLAAELISIKGMNTRTKFRDEFSKVVPFKVEKKNLNSTESLKIHLAAGGGTVIMLSPGT